MKKRLLFIPFFFLVVSVLFAQNTGPVTEMDATVKALAGEINKKLSAEKSARIAVGQFPFQNTTAPLSTYWANQLGEELTNIPDRSFAILTGGSSGADLAISGEIVELAGTIRIYTRLVRSDNRTITATFHSDFERNEHIIQMLSLDDSRSGHRSSRIVAMDEWEPDSFDNPVPYETGFDENAALMNRTIHSGDDEDFFLLLPDRNGRLVMETTGDIDTCMELFDVATREKLEEDDDGGSSLNARIIYDVQAGQRYIVKVRGYDSGDTGQYGFRACFSSGINPGAQRSP